MIQQMYPQVEHPFEYELNKDFQFAAAHYVPSPKAGKCQQMHGHTYFVNVTVAGNQLDDTGFLVNFSFIKELIHDRFDHTLLNDHHKDFNNNESEYFPTTEVVARTIYELVSDFLAKTDNKATCVQVFLRETPTSYCIYRPRKLLRQLNAVGVER